MALTYSYNAANDDDFLTNGEYPARLIKIIDLGNQEVTYSDKAQPQILFEFEVFTRSGKSFTVNRQFNVSFYPTATLRKFLETWRTRNYTPQDLEDIKLDTLLGMTGMMKIVINTTGGKSYTNIDSIYYVKGLSVPPSSNTFVILDFAQPNLDVFNSLPEWIQNKILRANNCPRLFSGEPEPQSSFVSPFVPQNNSGFENSQDFDDIPF